MNHRQLTPAERREIEKAIDNLRSAMFRERIQTLRAAIGRAEKSMSTASKRALARAGLVVHDGGKR